MSSRVAEKQRLREEREERERAATSAAQRKRRLGLLGAAVLVAAVAVAVAIALSSSGGSGSSGGSASKPSATTQLFAGIPQKGVVLGKANAPVTLTEFADLQCPACKAYTLDVLPTLVRRYVRTGRVRMVFRNILILGPDSRTAAQAAAAAGLQNHLWQFADRFYHDQREENSGYVTDGFVKQVAAQVPGLNATRLLSQRNSVGALQQLATATTVSQVRGVNATPTFFLGRTGSSGKELQPTALTLDQFTGPIDKQLAAR